MAAKRGQPRRAKKRTVALHEHPLGATALDGHTSDGSRVAGYENLRVLITKQDGAWLAQGLEIDYAVDGETVAEVKQRFETGLAMTIESHLRVNGHIRELLRAAPPEYWVEYFDPKHTLHRHTHTQILFAQLQQHLPFDKIVYKLENDEAA